MASTEDKLKELRKERLARLKTHPAEATVINAEVQDIDLQLAQIDAAKQRASNSVESRGSKELEQHLQRTSQAAQKQAQRHDALKNHAGSGMAQYPGPLTILTGMFVLVGNELNHWVRVAGIKGEELGGKLNHRIKYRGMYPSRRQRGGPQRRWYNRQAKNSKKFNSDFSFG